MDGASTSASSFDALVVAAQNIMKSEGLLSASSLGTQRRINTRPTPLIASMASTVPFLTLQDETRASIQQLPLELLVEIFIATDRPDILASICRHWRLVAIATPILWQQPPTRNHEATLCYLFRSKNAPLDISIAATTTPATVSAVLRHIHRFRTLHMEYSEKFLFDFQKVHRDAPQLEELTIEPWDYCEGRCTFDPAAFGITTKLRKLDLTNICLDMCDILSLPALTHLTLQDITVTHDTTGVELTQMLRGLPCLKELSMSFGDVELQEYSAAIPLEPIDLPQLTTLDICPRSRNDHINHFLSHATLPGLQRLFIHYYKQRPTVEYSGPSIEKLTEAIRNGDIRDLDFLSIGFNAIRMRRLLTKSEKLGPYVEIYGQIDQFDADDFNIAKSLITCFVPRVSNATSSLVRLTIFSLALDSSEVQQLFGDHPSLEHVEFSSELAESFIEALDIPLNHCPDLSIPFPKLSSIAWHGKEYYSRAGPPYPDPELFDAFIDCLIQRCEYGAPIHAVVMRQCSSLADSNVSRRLKEVVINVEVLSGYW